MCENVCTFAWVCKNVCTGASLVCVAMCDISVRNWSESHQKTAKNLGFKFVCVNLHLNSKNNIPQELSALPPRDEDAMVINRVTFILQNSDNFEELETKIFPLIRARVDFFAIRPAHESQLLALLRCAHIAYDLVSFDLSSGHFFSQFGASIKALNASENFVEIEIVSCVAHPANTISQTRAVLARVDKCVVSSGAKSVLEMRSPVDLENWAKILGLKKTKKNIQKICQKIEQNETIKRNIRRYTNTHTSEASVHK